MKYVYLILVILLFKFTGVQGQNLENLDKISERKLFQLKGMLSLSTNYYLTTRENPYQNPFRYILNGSPVVSVYGFDVPLSFTFANENFSVSGPDNFRRIGISPYYKWIKIHAGYRNVSFSPYTLNNHNFFGGGVELSPGKWRLGFVYGRFLNANPEDTTTVKAFPPSYKRTGYSFKLGYGTNSNFIDISVLNLKDDPNSIDAPIKSKITPAENLALGFSTRQTIAKRIIFELHLAASAFTEDISGEEISLKERYLPSFLSDIFQPYMSTRINFAGHTNLTYRVQAFSLKAEYMRIDPEYETMGSYYFNNDLERYSLSPSFSIGLGVVNVSGSLGVQRDNLLNNKAATTKRIIGSANLQIAPSPKFTLNAQYGNYATQQESGLIHLNDTIRIYQVNQNVNVTPTFLITGNNLFHHFILSLGSQTLIDKNIFTEDFTESQVQNANFNYRIHNHLIKYGLTFGLNYLTLDSKQTGINRYGFSFGVDKDLLKEKVNLKLLGMYNLSKRNEKDDGNLINGSFDLRYIPHPKHAFSFRCQAILNRTTVQYDDYFISANYSFTL